MLKYSSLILLVAVAIFWSHVDAEPKHMTISLRHPKALGKREAENDSTTESDEKSIKNLLALMLLLSTDNSAEEQILSEKYYDALHKEWDSLDDFGKYIVEAYEEVVGKKLDDLSTSDEESSEESDEA